MQYLESALAMLCLMLYFSLQEGYANSHGAHYVLLNFLENLSCKEARKYTITEISQE
jgi:hypothetical protein